MFHFLLFSVNFFRKKRMQCFAYSFFLFIINILRREVVSDWVRVDLNESYTFNIVLMSILNKFL